MADQHDNLETQLSAILADLARGPRERLVEIFAEDPFISVRCSDPGLQALHETLERLEITDDQEEK